MGQVKQSERHLGIVLGLGLPAAEIAERPPTALVRLALLLTTPPLVKGC